MKTVLGFLLTAVIWAGVGFYTGRLDVKADQYYLPAELVARSDTYAFFSTEQGVYTFESEFCRDDGDVPYLLTMFQNGTPDDVTDDQILVVWSTK